MNLPVRHRLVGLLFTGSAVNFIDRVNISVAAPSMMAATGIQKDSFGLVFSAFLLGYALTQIPGGILADRRSPRLLLIIAFAGFSLFTALTPVATNVVIWLLLVRFMVGVCEGPTFPAVTAFNSRWFPPTELGRAQTISLAGGSVGQMIAYPLTTWIIIQYSWEAVFYISALLGVVWIIVWAWYAKDHPATHPRMTARELQLIETSAVRNLSPAPSLAFKSVLSSPRVLLLAASAAFFALVLWTFMFWLPTYLIEARGFTLVKVGALGVAIQGCGFLGTATSGVVSDTILRRTGRPRLARTVYAAVCVLLAAALLVAAVAVASSTLSICLFGLCYFCLQSVHVAYLTTPAIFDPQRAASIYGVVNCFASLGAMCGPVLAGVLMTNNGDWAQTFGLIAGFGVLAATLLLSVPVARMKERGAQPLIAPV